MFEYTIVENFMNENECISLLEYSIEKSNLKRALVSTDKKDEINESIRKSNVAFNDYTEKFPYIKDRLEKIISKEINLKGMEVNLENDIFQFTEYKIGDFYNWHQDGNEKYTLGNRYCSIVILLNDNYEGGVLEIKNFGEDEITYVDKKIGKLIIFLSQLKHRVSPVKKGVRYSLVNWFSLKESTNFKKTLL